MQHGKESELVSSAPLFRVVTLPTCTTTLAGSSHETDCKWLGEEYSLAEFIANGLKERNLCASFAFELQYYFVF